MKMSQITITLLFLAFAIIMFMLEKIPLGVTSMIVCVGLVVTGVLDCILGIHRQQCNLICCNVHCRWSTV
jgi:di/tricarboxylate transporter